jgi:hypothetical protein
LYTKKPQTTTAPVINVQPSTITSIAQTEPVKQEENTHSSASIIQQGFWAATLLDPYANRGKKDFTSTSQTQVPAEPAIVSAPLTSSLSTTTTDVITTSAPILVTLPIQPNLRKVSPSRSAVDVNFKLKPVSSLPTLNNDDIKPLPQQTMKSTGLVKSTLAGDFTDEEELVLLGQKKMSKLRISNDFVDPSYQSTFLRSLYPVRRLADLEKSTTIAPPLSLSSSPTTTVVDNQRTSPSSSKCI